MTVKFGQRDNQNNSGGEFIRGFRDPETRVRALEEPSTWEWYFRHFNHEIRRYHPCTREPNCIGCQSLDERTQKVSRQYLFNALDAKGVVRVYECGKKLYNKFGNKADRWGSITSRDSIVTRSGKGLDTDYDIEPGEVSTIDMDALELHNIETVLSDSYNRALGRLNVVREEELSDLEEGLGPQSGVTATEGTNGFDPLTASNEDLKDWLTSNEVDFKKTANRAALVALVQQAIG